LSLQPLHLQALQLLNQGGPHVFGVRPDGLDYRSAQQDFEQ
jgi:hypothetical protein